MQLRRSRVVPPVAVALLVTGMALLPASRNPRFYLTDDSAAQFLPSWYHLGELLRSGQFPLLDPTLWAGGNIAAEALFGIWNPVLLGTMVFVSRSEEHTSELQSRRDLVCRLLLEKKKKQQTQQQ